MAEIPNIKLNTGYDMPVLGFGTWQLKGEQCKESVRQALELGYNHIDTAEMYGNEEYVGEAIKGIDRSSLFITSKVWPQNLSYDGVKKAFENSVSKLGTDYLDLYLIHWPSKEADYDSVLKSFKELIDEGKIKSFGVSNFTTRLLDDITERAEKAGIKISVNQVEFHPMLYQKKLLDYCKEKGITVTAYSPLGRGSVFGNDALSEIARNHDMNEGQVSLAWLRQRGLIAIPKASSREHIKGNLESLNLELSDDELKKIDELGKDERIVDPGFVDFDD